MEIKSLKGLTLDQLFGAFQNAFADYEMQLQKEQLGAMLKRRGFVPELSFGAFDGKKLVSFTFNGKGDYNGIPTAYDTGTGTTKEYRGMGLAQKIFTHSIPYLKAEGIKQYILEVLQHNEGAVHLYSKMGFEVVREFDYYVCEKSMVKVKGKELDKMFKVEHKPNLQNVNLSQFWDFNPSWQNSVDSILRQAEAFNSIGVYKDDKLVAYLVFEPQSGDITQLAVLKEYRNNGIASNLMQRALKLIESSEIKLINVECTSSSTNGFIKSLEIKKTGKQFEMVKQL